MAVVETPDDVILTAPAPNGSKSGSTEVIGLPGTRTYFYRVVVYYPIGVSVSEPILVRNAPDILSVTNYVLISWESAPMAVHYDLLRTDTPEFPSQTGNYAVHIGIHNTFFQDQGAALQTYDLTGLKYGAPAQCLIHLNNRDYPQPTLEMPCQLRVTRLLFSDGTSQDTAGGGGGGGGTPGGSSGQVQFNSNGSFGGSNSLVWNNALQRLGIGTSNPQYNLDVNGSARVGSSLVFADGSMQTSSGQKQTPWESNIDGATYRLFNVGSIGVGAVTEQMVIAGTQILMQGGPGDVAFSAVNTTSNGTSALRLRSGPVTGGFAGSFETSSIFAYPGLRITGSPGMQLVTTSGPMVFNAGPGTRMLIANDTGFIGIGTTTPAYRLDVAGNGRFTGPLRVGSFAFAAEPGDLGVSRDSSPPVGTIWFGNNAGLSYLSADGVRFEFGLPAQIPRLGIGVAPPSTGVVLDVSGDGRVNGGFRVGAQAQAPAAGDLGISHNPNPTQGIIRFGNTTTAFVVFNATSFYFTHPLNAPQLILRDTTNTVANVMSISLDNRGWLQIVDNANNTRALVDQQGRWYFLPAYEVSSGAYMLMPGMEVGYYVESPNEFGKPGFACVSASSGSSCYMFIAGRSLGVPAGIAENFNMMCSTDIVFHTNTQPPFSGEVMRLTKGGRVSITPPGQRGDPQFQLDVEGDINIKDPAPGINGFTFRINGASVMSLITTVESRLAADETRIAALEARMA